MRKASDFLSKPLISLNEGRNEGIIKNISFDTKLRNAEWLVLYDENDSDCDEKAVKVSEIYALGENAVMIKSGQAVVPAVSAPLNDNNPINCRIFTAEGKLTGIVSDVNLTDKNAVIELLYDKSKALPLSEVVSSSRDIVVTGTDDLKIKALRPQPKKVPEPRSVDAERVVEALESEGDIFDVAEKIEKRVKEEKAAPAQTRKAAPARTPSAPKKTSKKVTLKAAGAEKEVIAVRADNKPGEGSAPHEHADPEAEKEAARQKERFEQGIQKELVRLAAREKNDDTEAAAENAGGETGRIHIILKPQDENKTDGGEAQTPASVKEILINKNSGESENKAAENPPVIAGKAAEKNAAAEPARVKKNPEITAPSDPYKIYDDFSSKPLPEPAGDIYIYGGAETDGKEQESKKEKALGVAVPLKKNGTYEPVITAYQTSGTQDKETEPVHYIVVDSGENIQIWPYELEHIPERIIADYAFLLGRRVTKNIYNGAREIIIKANSVVNPQLVETARKYGRLVDLTKLSK